MKRDCVSSLLYYNIFFYCKLRLVLVLLLIAAHYIWTIAKQTYFRVGNGAQVYELRNKVHETKQKRMTVSAYSSQLHISWHELEYYQDFQADCVASSAKFKKLVDKEMVYDFLAGLNLEYDPVRI